MKYLSKFIYHVHGISENIHKGLIDELIYNLAEELDGYVTEKQKLRIRRAMFKSNDSDIIIKYALELD